MAMMRRYTGGKAHLGRGYGVVAIVTVLTISCTLCLPAWGRVTKEQGRRTAAVPPAIASGRAEIEMGYSSVTSPCETECPGSKGASLKAMRHDLDIAFRFFVMEEFADAEAAFIDFLNRYGDSSEDVKRGFHAGTHADTAAEKERMKLLTEVRYWLGESFFRQMKFPQAAFVFSQMYERGEGIQYAPEILLLFGTSLSRLGQLEQACELFKELKYNFPDVSPEFRGMELKEVERAGCTRM